MYEKIWNYSKIWIFPTAGEPSWNSSAFGFLLQMHAEVQKQIKVGPEALAPLHMCIWRNEWFLKCHTDGRSEDKSFYPSCLSIADLKSIQPESACPQKSLTYTLIKNTCFLNASYTPVHDCSFLNIKRKRNTFSYICYLFDT